MVQTSDVYKNDDLIQSALEQTLSMLGDQLKKLILYVLSEKINTDLSSVEAIEQDIIYLLGPQAQIIVNSFKQRLQK